MTRPTPAPGVPWYVHPADAPDAWAAIPEVVHPPGFVVVNVHNGPGEADDPYYPSAVAALGGTSYLGYVDVGYGRRPVEDVAADVARWVEWYRCPGVMLDQMPASEAAAGTVAAYVAAARRRGADFVAGNPGVVAAPEVLDLFDAACVVEVTASTYLSLDLTVPRTARGVATWHLVHTCPPDLAPLVRARAAEWGADFLHVTAQTMPNPWRGFDARPGVEDEDGPQGLPEGSRERLQDVAA